MNKIFILDLKERIKKNFSRFIIIFIISVLIVLVIRFNIFANINVTIGLLIPLLIILFIICLIIIRGYYKYNYKRIDYDLKHTNNNITHDSKFNYDLYKTFTKNIEEYLSFSMLSKRDMIINETNALLKTNYPKLPDEIREKYAYKIYKLLKD